MLVKITYFSLIWCTMFFLYKTLYAEISGLMVIVKPGEDIQKLININSKGTTFFLQSGIYRMQQLHPKDGNTFIGEPDTILSGARVLSSFIRKDGFWVAVGQTQQGQVHGQCRIYSNGTQMQGCKYPEDLFIDDVPLFQVTSLSELEPGKWFFDYARNEVYLTDDPRNHKVEISVTRHAFEGPAQNITITKLVVEKYANPAQHGAIHARNGTSGPSGKNWVITDCEIRFNHGAGISVRDGAHIFDNYIHHNGQLGIDGRHINILVENNEIAYNNTQGYAPGWTAGGAKFGETNNLVVRGNYVHHNAGAGLWTDHNNLNTLYENNHVSNNEGPGIFHEISYAAKIKNNIVEGNGFVNSTWLWGAGIQVVASPDVEIYRNTVTNNANGIVAIQQKRGSGPYGPFEVKNLFVHDNLITMTVGMTGLGGTGDPAFFLNRNIKFKNNSYCLDSNKNYFSAGSLIQTVKDWKALGQDVKGTFIRMSNAKQCQKT